MFWLYLLLITSIFMDSIFFLNIVNFSVHFHNKNSETQNKIDITSDWDRKRNKHIFACKRMVFVFLLFVSTTFDNTNHKLNTIFLFKYLIEMF